MSQLTERLAKTYNQQRTEQAYTQNRTDALSLRGDDRHFVAPAQTIDERGLNELLAIADATKRQNRKVQS